MPVLATTPSASPSPVSGTTTTLAANANGGTAPYTYVWTVTVQPVNSSPTFDDTTLSGPVVTFDMAGDYTFSVTVTDAAVGTATATVDVTVSQTATSVVVSPAQVGIANLPVCPFTAAVLDQFADPISGAPITWSYTPGGAIDSAGLFTQSGDVVTATSNALTGTASLIAHHPLRTRPL